MRVRHAIGKAGAEEREGRDRRRQGCGGRTGPRMAGTEEGKAEGTRQSTSMWTMEHQRVCSAGGKIRQLVFLVVIDW